MMMKKQFFRVKQLADQTIFKADKSEVLNCPELQHADQKLEFLRHALTAIQKRLPTGPQPTDEKKARRCLESGLAAVFKDLYVRSCDSAGFSDTSQCRLFIEALKQCDGVEGQLLRNFANLEAQIDAHVTEKITLVLEQEFPSIAKHKKNLTRYILDKDSANNRYNNSTRKEALQDDKDEAESKVEQTRDLFAYEMFSLLAQENDFACHLLQLLKCQRGYHEIALRHLEEIIPVLEQKIGDSDVRRVYNIPLAAHLSATNDRIALPLRICIGWLRDSALHEEGLFRIAGSTSRVKRLKSSIDSGCFVFHPPPAYLDPHVVASTLKLYLRELPDPLLTFDLHHAWIASMHIANADDKHQTVRDLVHRLPPPNRDNLNYLMKFLAELSHHSADNKMNASNIAIVMSPNLLWEKNEQSVNMVNCAAVNTLVEYFIRHYDRLFEDEFRIRSPFKQFRTSTESLDNSPKVVRKKKAAPVPPSAGDGGTVGTLNRAQPEKRGETSRPIAAPRSVDIDRRPLSRAASIRNGGEEEVTLRKPEIRSKPELLPRPQSVQKRASIDGGDANVQKQQCLVYSTANVQQASWMVVSRGEGHDLMMGEKERFLGHRRDDVVENVGDVNSNGGGGRGEMAKSDENLSELNALSNGNRRMSHVRTRSDGNLAGRCGGGGGLPPVSPSSPKALMKPTQAPPPPPVGTARKFDFSSTDL